MLKEVANGNSGARPKFITNVRRWCQLRRSRSHIQPGSIRSYAKQPDTCDGSYSPSVGGMAVELGFPS
jgi:hypothetical protein